MVVLNSCNIFEKNQTSNFMLRLLSLTGLPSGEEPSNIKAIGTAIIYSDAVHETPSENGKTNDLWFTPNYAIAELEMGFLNPDVCNDTYSSVYTDLIIYRIDVEFTRPDGNNIQGETIPNPFSLSVHARITSDLVLYMPFPVVRVLEKRARPMNQLYSGGEIQLTCICTIYARDPVGHEVKPEVAAITVMCANYVDPDMGSE